MSVASIHTARPSRRIGAWSLQGVLAAAFLAAGVAKLTSVSFMVDLFAQIGIGQWFRFVTGAVEVAGAVAKRQQAIAGIDRSFCHVARPSDRNTGWKCVGARHFIAFHCEISATVIW